MPTSKVAMVSRNANGCKSIFLRSEGIVMIRNRTRNGKGEVVAKIDFTNPEGFGLEFVQRGLNELSKHKAPKNGIMEWWNNVMIKSIFF
jgi:hypothetical protein